MTTRNPDPSQPEGADVMEPGPEPGTPGAQSLLDAGSVSDDGPAGVPEGMIEAAKRGDALDTPPGDSTGVGGTDDALSPADAGLPQARSEGRGEGAGHRQGGMTNTFK
ncbi:MAG: hypothetical protein M3P95_13315 [Actinomycetota bacterium]|jgi:hypothetical protein|nr:hypothetical protein [Actinomycetota bacterium]